ncbi:MAG: uridine diphosphate-N-acetylglucosamine-binding protein YvcK [Erysipelotrichaceae bacterium]|nr:uridine diphosphate-N-acetylglucosamine-binding protein YvcK [Erysipelotrichaceae bacterium]
MKKVVVIGGGHGQAAVLRGLKDIDSISLTTIVTVADDGGSTGKLRRDFQIPAMGDIRGVMIALAESETLLSTLMDYRFDESSETMGGHNLGNIILTALTQSTGSFMDAISMISKVLKVKGHIVPSTTQVITLYAIMEDGTIVRGESNIPKVRNHIQKVYYKEKVKATDAAIRAISDADYIVYGAGSLYTSILPNIIIDDIKLAIQQSKAKKIYFCNPMTQSGETEFYTVEDHVKAIESHVQDKIDKVFVASDMIPNEVLKAYLLEHSTKVPLSEKEHEYDVELCSLLSFENRLVRHDAKKVKEVFLKELGE